MWGRLGVFQCSVPHHLEVLRCRQNWWGSNDFIYKGHPHWATVHHNLCSCTALQCRITGVLEHKRELAFRIELQRLVFSLIYWSKGNHAQSFQAKMSNISKLQLLRWKDLQLLVMYDGKHKISGLWTIGQKKNNFCTFKHFFLHLMNFDKLTNRESNLQNN